MIMATNRPDVLDPALMRPGRLDRKIEIPLPNEQARMEILKIHAVGVAKHGDIDYEAIVKLAENFNGADLRNICTEAGMFAIRDERDYTVQVSIPLEILLRSWYHMYDDLYPWAACISIVAVSRHPSNAFSSIPVD